MSTTLYAIDMVSLGERLFREGRFSQHFYQQSQGDVNHSLNEGSSDLEMIDLFGVEQPSPFRGEAKSCASCHMSDEAQTIGSRIFNEFSALSKIPLRTDKLTHSLRNTPGFFGMGSKFAQNRTSHWDGEFFDHSETVLGNFTGRNMGWLGHERRAAYKNIAKVIKKDDGTSELAQKYGGSYQQNILDISGQNVQKLNDSDVINIVVEAVTAFMNQQDFQKNEKGEYNGSPYDQFLIANGIDTVPKNGETIFEYTGRVRLELAALKSPQFIKKKFFKSHQKEFGFEQKEWEGLKVFFNITGTNSRGLCIACHTPPLFSDQFYYNIGSTQFEYEDIHGIGSFNQLAATLPSYQDRGKKKYADRPTLADAQKVDLGLWNFFGRNKDVTKLIKQRLCRDPENCPNEKALPFMLARVKTPGLRQLNLSAPYFHHGKLNTLREAVDHYRLVNEASRQMDFVNLDPRMRNLRIGISDVRNLEAFLNALNEEL